MKTVDTRKFRKNLEKLPPSDQISVLDALDAIELAESFSEVRHLKPLKGHKNFYRLRVGNYRIGLFWTGEVFSIEDVGPRGDFYKRFP